MRCEACQSNPICNTIERILNFFYSVLKWLFKHPKFSILFILFCTPFYTAYWLFWQDVEIEVLTSATPSSTILVHIDTEKLTGLTFKNTLRKAFQTPFDLNFSYHLCFTNNTRFTIKDHDLPTHYLDATTTMKFKYSDSEVTKSYVFKGKEEKCEDFSNISEIEIVNTDFPTSFEIRTPNVPHFSAQLAIDTKLNEKISPNKDQQRVSAMILVFALWGVIASVLGIVESMFDFIYDRK